MIVFFPLQLSTVSPAQCLTKSGKTFPDPAVGVGRHYVVDFKNRKKRFWSVYVLGVSSKALNQDERFAWEHFGFISILPFNF